MDVQKEDYTDNGRWGGVEGLPPLHWQALQTSRERRLEQVEPVE